MAFMRDLVKRRTFTLIGAIFVENFWEDCLESRVI